VFSQSSFSFAAFAMASRDAVGIGWTSHGSCVESEVSIIQVGKGGEERWCHYSEVKFGEI
jgi:hypothetical protein